MAAIERFDADPVESGLKFSWDLSSALINHTNCRSIYLYINSELNDGVVKEVKVIPLLQTGTNNLTTDFSFNNLVNGTKYLTQLEITVVNSGVRTVYTKSTEGIPSTIPPRPFVYVEPSQSKDSGFDIQITKTKGRVTKLLKNDVDDGHSELTGVYVVFTDGETMSTTYIDASGRNLYEDVLHIDAPFGDYEVAISIENKNGRSDLSESEQANVNSSISAVRVTRVIEEMAVDPSASVSYDVSYNTPRILLTWNAPSNKGTPALNKYMIRRAEVDSSGNVGAYSTQDNQSPTLYLNTLSYVTDSSYSWIDTTAIEGKKYRYNIQGENDNGLGADGIFINTSDKIKNKTITTVVWPEINTITTKPDDRQSVIDIKVNGGFDPSANHQFTVKYTANLLGASSNSITSSNPVTLTGLTNNTEYILEVIANMLSPNQDGIIYKTDPDTSKRSTPINAIPGVSLFTASPLDASGINPLDRKVRLTWRTPSVGTFTGLRYIIERRESGSPDGSYNVDTSGNVPNSSTNMSYESTGLTNGKMYDFKIYTTYANSETSTDYKSTEETRLNIMPFARPAAPTNVQLNYINSTTDLSYQYVDISVNDWGSSIVGHKYTLYNLNNNGQSTVLSEDDLDGSFNSTRRGRLATLLRQSLSAGTKYALDVQSFIIVNGVKYYSTPTPVASLNYTWTKPTGITDTVASNSELLNGVVTPLSSSVSNGIVRLSWNPPVNQDASSISYRVFRNVGDISLNDTTTNTSFDITSLTIGASATAWYVLALMDGSASGIISDKSSATTASGSAIFNPAAVTGSTITLRNVSSTKFDFSFNGVTYHGGMNSTLTKYLVELIDTSGNQKVSDVELSHALVVTGSFDNLTSGRTYKIKITTRAVNTLNGANQIVESTTATTSSDIAPYDEPINVTKFEVKPADSSIVVKWEPVGTDPEGLVYSDYKISWKVATAPEASYNDVGNSDTISTKTTSSYVIQTLSNGTRYSVKMTTIYQDRILASKESNATGILFATPGVGPITPGAITTTVLENGDGITFAWPIPTDEVTHYSFTIDGSNVNFHYEEDNISVDDLLNGSQFKYTLSGLLEPGKTYIIRLYAEREQQENGIIFYSSSSASEATVTTFRNPGEPRNLSATLGDKEIHVEWDAPLDTAGKGDDLEYEIYLSEAKDGSGAWIPLAGLTIVDADGTSLTASSNNNFILDAKGVVKPIDRLPITIQNNGTNVIVNQKPGLIGYTVLVRSRFVVKVGGTDQTQNSIDYASLEKLFPRLPPNKPTLDLELVQQASGKSFINVTIDSDSSFNVERYDLYRRIYDASTNQLLTQYTKIYEKLFAKDEDDNTSDSNRVDIFVDNNSSLSNSAFWLDGNKFEYKVAVHYNDNNINPESGSNGDGVIESDPEQIVKTSPPFPCDVQGRPTGNKVALITKALDASNNFSYFINKAGSSIHSVSTVLVDLSNVSVITTKGSLGSLAVNQYAITDVPNARIDSITAANQIVRVTIKAEPAKIVDDVLSIAANSVGTTIGIWPQDGSFANLRD